MPNRSGRASGWVLAWLGVAGCAAPPSRPAAAPPVRAVAPTGWAVARSPAPPDSDGDGIPDDQDRCPLEAETYNGCHDDDGCPDRWIAPRLRPPISLTDKIHFRPDSPSIQPIFDGSPGDGKPLLDVLIGTIDSAPTLELIEIQGHAASNERHPDRLAADRAEAVKGYLVAHGVAADRLLAHGYGSTIPLCTRPGQDCWATNRRVELSILRQTSVVIMPPVPPADCAYVAGVNLGRPPAAARTRASSGGPPDSDGDGIPDDRDHCPSSDETYNGCNDDDGCPDQWIAPGRIRRSTIVDKIYFRAGSAEMGSTAVDTRPDETRVLLVKLFNGDPTLQLIEIQGHAAPNERQADKLAAARATAVSGYLIAHGVAATRLIARGYGSSHSVCSQPNEGCWSKDRRVEFVVLRQPNESEPPPVPSGDCSLVL
jgi:outer membrane protein OmpA-like peptidoglycan-associated protein